MVRNIFFIGTMLITSLIIGQNATVAEFTTALKNGDSDSLITLLSDEVMIQIDDNEDYMSNAEATDRLAQFMKENPAKEIEIKHSGKSKDGTDFSIGTYSDENNNVMRLYIVVKDNKVAEFCVEND